MVYGFQMVGIALMLFTVMIPHPLQLGDTWPQAMHSLYLSCSKVTFTLGVYIMILPSLLSVPNMTFFLMDTKFFNFTSKISFWTYLIHYMIVETVSFSQKVDFYYTLGTILPLYFSIAVMSLFFGLVGTVLVEAPFAKLEKLLFEVILKGKKKDFNQSTMVEAKESLLSNQNSSLLGNKKESLLSSKNDSEGINRSIR